LIVLVEMINFCSYYILEDIFNLFYKMPIVNLLFID